ncbi:MAG: hypothetical protein IT450_13025 [Phycisphaerales bacterium]|nr:hypothetical protein [Phycisphaerales bacterium]
MKRTSWLLHIVEVTPRNAIVLSLFALGAAVRVYSSVTTRVDLLDSSDGGAQPPPGILCVDELIDVSRDDVWTAGGMRAFVTPAGLLDGVTIRYSAVPDDPNTPHIETLLSPGTADRFVTFVTQPRERDAESRYVTSGAQVAGRFSPTGPIERATGTEFNAAWFATPPPNSTSPSVDGAVARVAIDISMLLANHPLFEAFHVGDPETATGPIILESSTTEGIFGTVNASFDAVHIQGIDWAVWYTEVPEPASIVLLSLSLAVLGRLERHRV